MKEHTYLPNCDNNDVVIFEENNIVKAGKLKAAFSKVFTNSNIENTIYSELANQSNLQIEQNTEISNNDSEKIVYKNEWLGEGTYCEVLKLGAEDWQKGKIKVRVSVEFCPDEQESDQPESSIDDIRQTISK